MNRTTANGIVAEQLAAGKDLSTAMKSVFSNDIICPSLFPRASCLDGEQLMICHGMVQDMCDTPLIYSVPHSSVFGGWEPDSCTHDAMVTVEASMVYLVPVPGRLYSSSKPQPAATSVALQDEKPSSRARRWTKRPLEEDATVVDVIDERGAGEPLTSSSLGLSYPPVSPDLLCGCIAVVLGENCLNLNDVVTIWGFLVPSGTAVDDEFSSCRFERLPEGLVSRIVCVTCQRGPLPLVDKPLLNRCSDMNVVLCSWLSQQVTEGDNLAAELLAGHLASRVLLRTDCTPVGDLPILISSDRFGEAETVVSWASSLRSIEPLVGCVTLKLGGKAGPALRGRKCPETNCIIPGALQLPMGTHLILHTPVPLEFEDDDLMTLLHQQKVKFNFHYTTVSLDTDIRCLVLSGVALNLLHPSLRPSCNLCWMPQQKGPSHSTRECAAEIQRYLYFVRSLEVQFDDCVTKTDEILSMLVDAQAMRPEMFNDDPLIHNNSINGILSLARSLSLLRGSVQMEVGDVVKALELERQRLERNAMRIEK